MSNCMFAFPDFTLTNTQYGSPTLTGGSWSSGAGISNILLPDRTNVARTTNASSGSTIWYEEFSANKTIQLAALLNHNGSVNGTVKLDFYTDNTMGTLVASTNTQYFIADRSMTQDKLYGWKPDWFYTFANPITFKFVRITVVDTGNPDGYFEVGRCCLMPVWSPTINISWGQTMKYDHSNTSMSKSKSGKRYFNRQPYFRTSTMKMESLTENEAHMTWLEMQRKLGIDQELYFVKDPAATDFYVRQQSFLCTMREADALEHPYIDNFATNLILEEVL